MEHLLKLSSLTPDEIIHILDVADEYKRLHKAGTDPKDLQGKAIALMFGKHSTRTRTSLEVGIYQMGGLGTYLSAADMQIARGEPIQDTARVLGRYYDAIVYRTFKQSDVDALARYSGVPVVSGMTDYAHPLQVRWLQHGQQPDRGLPDDGHGLYHCLPERLPSLRRCALLCAGIWRPL